MSKTNIWLLGAYALSLSACSSNSDEILQGPQTGLPIAGNVLLALDSFPQATELEFVARDRQGVDTAQGKVSPVPPKGFSPRAEGFALNLPANSASLEFNVLEGSLRTGRGLTPLRLSAGVQSSFPDLTLDRLALPVSNLSLTLNGAGPVRAQQPATFSSRGTVAGTDRSMDSQVVFRFDRRFLAPFDTLLRPGEFYPVRPSQPILSVAHFNAPTVFVGAGPGLPPVVKAYASNSGLITSFFAFDPEFRGGVTVASGDFDGNGKLDLAVAPAGGSHPPVVHVYSAITDAVFQLSPEPTTSFSPYDPTLVGGLFIAAGDLNGDGRSDILTCPTPPHSPLDPRSLSGFSTTTTNEFREQANTFRMILSAPQQAAWAGAQSMAYGIDETNKPVIVTGSPTGQPGQVVVYNADGTLKQSFPVGEPGFSGGVNVAGGKGVIVAAPNSGGGGKVEIFEPGPKLIDTLQPFGDFSGGIRVAVGDYDGDGDQEILTTPGPGMGPLLTVFGKSPNQLHECVSEVLSFAMNPANSVYPDTSLTPQTPTIAQLPLTIQPAPNTGSLLVINSLGNSMNLYGPLQQLFGDLAPLLSIFGPASGLSQPFHVADSETEFYVTNNLGASVTVYSKQDPRTPIRTIQGPATTMTFPGGIALDTRRDILYVGNFGGGGRVLVFQPASTAAGNVAPVRIMTGFHGLFGLAVDPIYDRLYGAQVGSDSIAVIDDASSRNGALTAPDRQITSTVMLDPEGIFLDVPLQRLYVASQTCGVMAFDGVGQADGNQNPVLTLNQNSRDCVVDRSRDELITCNNDVARFQLTSPLLQIAPPLLGPNTSLSGPTGLLLMPPVPEPPQFPIPPLSPTPPPRNGH